MKRAIGVALFVGVGVFASNALAAPTDADKRKEAQTHFDAAMKLANDDDSKGALSEFRTAYATYPSFRVLYNIGQLCARMGDNACAVTTYQKYLRDGGADIPAARRTAVEGELAKLTKTVGTITVKSNVSGAEVRVDDASVGKTPLDPFVVNAGAHKIVLDAQGRTAERSIRIGAGEAQTVELDTEPKKEEPKPVAVTEKKEEPKPDVSAAPKSKPAEIPIVPWAVTGGLAVGTIVVGIFAAKSYGNYKDKKDSFPVTKSELDDAQSSARTLFIVTTALGAATVVAAGVSTYFTITAKKSDALRVEAGLGRIGIAGSF